MYFTWNYKADLLNWMNLHPNQFSAHKKPRYKGERFYDSYFWAVSWYGETFYYMRHKPFSNGQFVAFLSLVLISLYHYISDHSNKVVTIPYGQHHNNVPFLVIPYILWFFQA